MVKKHRSGIWREKLNSFFLDENSLSLTGRLRSRKQNRGRDGGD